MYNKKPRAFWESQREALIEMYVDKRMTLDSIANHYGTSTTPIKNWLRKFGVNFRKVGSVERSNGIYSVDGTYFDHIDTPNKA